MSTENDIESFIQLQKQKLAQERENLHQSSDLGQENKIPNYQPTDSTSTQKERAQWQAPSQLQIKQDPQYSNSLDFGSYDQKRKKLDEERKKDYNERSQRPPINKNQQNSPMNNNEGDVGMFSKLGQYESKRKVLDVERQNEYNKKLTATGYRRDGQQAGFSEPSLPGLRDHPSADQQKMKQRNAEYNEFLRLQEQKRGNRFADKKGFPVEPAPPPEPSRINHQEQRTPRRQARPAEQITPRGGYANPTYEELLEEKRREEHSYRRRNDPEAAGADTRRTYPPSIRLGTEERRFDELDRQYDRRKVKFANDRSYGDDSTDVYDWDYSNHGRSRSFYQDPEPKSLDPYERSRSVPPKEEAMTGLAIGHSETASAARRRKDQYRQELEQQMNSSRRVKPQQYGRGEFSTENDYPSPFSNPLAQPYPTSKPRGFSDQSGSILDDRRPLASILNERRDLVDTSPRGNAVRLGLGPGVLQSGFTGLYEPSALSHQQHQQQYPPPAAGYGHQPYAGPPQPYQTPSDPAYNHYATQDPLASFTAPPLGQPQYPNTSQQKYPSQQPRAAQSFNNPTAAVGAFPSERTDQNRQKKDNQQTYQHELKRQMEDKQRYQAAKKAEQEAYDRKLNAEIANYNPFGRGGAGAPMKDSTGTVVADLRSMNHANTGLTPRPDIQNPPAPASVNTISSFHTALPDLNLSAGADTLVVGHARGGHGIFGEPKTDVQKTAADKYKDDLRAQIEEKKRVAELEKQKLKDEEEREMKRLEEDRLKIQKEFEAEQAKAKAKEDETRRKNEEMKEAAEEKRKLAEQHKDQVEEKHRQKDEEARQRQQKEREEEERLREAKKRDDNRPESPPIPTMRSKTQPPGSMDMRENSPPLPTQRSKTQHDSTLTGSKPVIRDDEPPRNRAAEPSKRPESRVQSAEVLNQLAHMRQQLQQERQRVENALTKQKLDVDVYDPRSRITGNNTPSDVDVFEIARSRKPVSARKARSDTDSQSSGQAPIAKPPTATSLLQSDSAFIDDSGMRAAFPDDFDALASNQNARRRRRERLQPSQEVIFEDEQDDISLLSQRDAESIHSVDPDRITRKNQERLRKLKAIAGDDISLDDPDDIIDRFMTKQSHNRPPSGQTLTDETWINSNMR